MMPMFSNKLKESQQKIGGINTFYLSGGNGKPIVFLHGVPSFSYLWREVMSYLTKDFSCYAPDLPGYANSGLIQDPSLESYSTWLLDFCDLISPNEKINLVVHDVGGPIGIAFVLKQMERIDRLVIMDTVISSEELPLAMKIAINPIIVWTYLHLTNRTVFKWIMRLTVNQKNSLDEDTINQYYRVFLQDKKTQTSARILKALREELDKTVSTHISKISCPTLVLWAEKDFVLPVSVAKNIKAQISNSQLKTLPNCGHFSQEEEPELVAAAIRDFLNS